MYTDHAQMIRESGLPESIQTALRSLVETADRCGYAGEDSGRRYGDGPTPYEELTRALDVMIEILKNTEREARNA